jgi:hypothetical protein
MNILNNFNIITILLAGVFIIPILSGIANPISPQGMKRSLFSMVHNLEMIAGIIITFYIYRGLQNGKWNQILDSLYQLMPSVRTLVTAYEHNLAANAGFLLLLFTVVVFILNLLMTPVSRFVLVPLVNGISSAVNSFGNGSKRIIGGLWQIPRSIWLVLVCSLLLNLYLNVGTNAEYKGYIKQSGGYQKISAKAVEPLLGSEFAQKIPVLINDSFRKINGGTGADGIGLVDSGVSGNSDNLPIIEYFNGVTLDEAIKSNDAIDRTAKKIAGAEAEDKKKAYLLYKWISSNITYDYDKAEQIVADPAVVDSGSKVAYTEKRGVCFDYATLYVSMCRAVDLKVRLVTGLGYSGSVWGDHAWNQVYSSEENRWINVDATFGSSGYDYFDRANFSSSHKDAEIQGEW